MRLRIEEYRSVVPDSQENGTFHIKRENSRRTFPSLSGQLSWTLLEAKLSPICSSDQSNLVSAKKSLRFLSGDALKPACADGVSLPMEMRASPSSVYPNFIRP